MRSFNGLIYVSSRNFGKFPGYKVIQKFLERGHPLLATHLCYHEALSYVLSLKTKVQQGFQPPLTKSKRQKKREKISHFNKIRKDLEIPKGITIEDHPTKPKAVVVKLPSLICSIGRGFPNYSGVRARGCGFRIMNCFINRGLGHLFPWDISHFPSIAQLKKYYWVFNKPKILCNWCRKAFEIKENITDSKNGYDISFKSSERY